LIIDWPTGMGSAKSSTDGRFVCSTQGSVSDVVRSTRDMGDFEGSETKGAMGYGHVNQTFQKMRVLHDGDESTAV
jgi:hypothetical protein